MSNTEAFLPSDLPEWDDAVCEAYQLEKVLIEDQHSLIKLLSPCLSAKYFATAPYFYDGGVKLEEKRISDSISDKLDSVIQERKLNYLLLKTRYELTIEIGRPVIVDTNYYTFLLDLSKGEEEVWKNCLKAKTRNQVRKAEKYNFDVRIGREALLQDFYSVISEVWRDLGTPTHSKGFYRLIIEKLKNNSSFMVVYYRGEPVSCALLLLVDNVIYHPYSCTLNRVKSTCVNNLLYWEIIKYACNNNCTYFDMGRSRIGQGTFKYKESWGAVAKKLYYSYILENKSQMPSYDKLFYRFATGAWKFMPLSLANRIGPSLIKNVL